MSFAGAVRGSSLRSSSFKNVLLVEFTPEAKVKEWGLTYF